MTHVARVQLTEEQQRSLCVFVHFLQPARPNWTPLQAEAAALKLLRIGILTLKELKAALCDEPEGALNMRLKAAGEKLFTSQTLDALRERAEFMRTANTSRTSGTRQSQRVSVNYNVFVNIDVEDVDKLSDQCLANIHYYVRHRDEFYGDHPDEPLLQRLSFLICREQETHGLWTIGGSEHTERRLLGLDVGANVGASLDMVRDCCGASMSLEGGEQRRNRSIHIFAFEPNNLNIPILRRRIRCLEKASTLTASVCPIVASNAKGPVRFYVNRRRNFSGNPHGSVHDLSGEYDEDDDKLGQHVAQGSTHLELQADTIDNVLWGDSDTSAATCTNNRGSVVAAGFPADAPIDFVKLDTEGHEWAVLQGMNKTLQQTRFLYFECSHLLKAAGTSVKEVVDWLDERGFNTYRVGSRVALQINGACYHPFYDVHLYWSNCLAIRKDEVLARELLDGFILK